MIMIIMIILSITIIMREKNRTVPMTVVSAMPAIGKLKVALETATMEVTILREREEEMVRGNDGYTPSS